MDRRWCTPHGVSPHSWTEVPEPLFESVWSEYQNGHASFFEGFLVALYINAINKNLSVRVNFQLLVTSPSDSSLCVCTDDGPRHDHIESLAYVSPKGSVSFSDTTARVGHVTHVRITVKGEDGMASVPLSHTIHQTPARSALL